MKNKNVNTNTVYRHYAIYRCVVFFKSKMVTAEGWMVTAGEEWSSSQIVTILTWSVRMKPQIIEGLVFLCVLVQIALNREKKILYRAYFSELVASKRLTVLDSLNQKWLRKQTFGCRIRFVSKRWLFFYWYQSIFEANWNWSENTSKYKFALLLFYGISSTSF